MRAAGLGPLNVEGPLLGFFVAYGGCYSVDGATCEAQVRELPAEK